eukprot:298864_1
MERNQFHSSHNHNNDTGFMGNNYSQSVSSFENINTNTIHEIDSYLYHIDRVIGNIDRVGNRNCLQQELVKEIADLRKKLSAKCAETEILSIQLVKQEQTIIDLKSELSIKDRKLNLKCTQYNNLQKDFIELQETAVSECDRQMFDYEENNSENNNNSDINPLVIEDIINFSIKSKIDFSKTHSQTHHFIDQQIELQSVQTLMEELQSEQMIVNTNVSDNMPMDFDENRNGNEQVYDQSNFNENNDAYNDDEQYTHDIDVT